MADPVDVIVSANGGSWSARAPQIPGLAIAQPTAQTMREAIPDAIRFGLDDPPLLPEIDVHVEYEIGEDVFVRVAQDRHGWERQHIAERLTASLSVEGAAGPLHTAPANKLGEVVYVCAMPSDRIGWFARQMEPAGDWLTAVVPVAEQLIWTFSLGTGPDDGAVSLEDLGVTPDTPMSSLMATAPVPPRARL